MTIEQTRASFRDEHGGSKKRRPWSRKKKWLVFAGVPLALMGTTAAAAAYFALAGVQGSGKNAEFTAAFESTAPTVDTSGLTMQPTGAASISGGKLVLPAGLQMFPGESFTVSAQVKAGSSQYGYVSGVALPGLPSGYTAELTSGCGKSVQYAQGVTIKVTAPAVQTAGAAWTLTSDAGVQVTPTSSSAVPGGVTCAKYVAP